MLCSRELKNMCASASASDMCKRKERLAPAPASWIFGFDQIGYGGVDGACEKRWPRAASGLTSENPGIQTPGKSRQSWNPRARHLLKLLCFRMFGSQPTCKQVPRAGHLLKPLRFRNFGSQPTCQQIPRARHLLTMSLCLSGVSVVSPLVNRCFARGTC